MNIFDLNTGVVDVVEKCSFWDAPTAYFLIVDLVGEYGLEPDLIGELFLLKLNECLGFFLAD